MKYTIHLRNTLTNDVVDYSDDYDWKTEGDMMYQWTEGNFSCDCNRSLFMYNHDEEKEMDCSDDNIIVIDKITDSNGKVVFHGNA